MGGSILGFIILIADIWALVRTLQSPVSGRQKILWFLVIFLLPVVGLILWLTLGPRPLRG